MGTALRDLALAYLHGQGVSPDVEKAIELLERVSLFSQTISSSGRAAQEG